MEGGVLFDAYDLPKLSEFRDGLSYHMQSF